jgi:hypothetical protein
MTMAGPTVQLRFDDLMPDWSNTLEHSQDLLSDDWRRVDGFLTTNEIMDITVPLTDTWQRLYYRLHSTPVP